MQIQVNGRKWHKINIESEWKQIASNNTREQKNESFTFSTVFLLFLAKENKLWELW